MNILKFFLISVFVFQSNLIFGQTLTVPSPVAVCFGSTGSIQATMSGGPGRRKKFRYDLFLGSNREDRITTRNTSVTFTDLQTGTYSVRVFKVNNGGQGAQIIDREDNISLLGETEAPVFQNPQSNISVSTDANICGALVSYSYPDVSDNCSPQSGSLSGYTYMGQFNGHTYYYSNSSATATNAIQNSSNLGGHLVSIGSQAENDFIDNNVGASIWIGITDTNIEGDFQWLTSEPVTYTNWNGGEPNNSGSNEDHTEMYTNGKWNDLRGSNNRRYVVEFESVSLVQTLGLSSGTIFPVGTTVNTFEATDRSGNSASYSFSVIVSDDTPPEISQLRADYYDGRNFDTFKETLVVDELNYSWGTGAPESSLVGTDNFSIRFLANLRAPQDGTYTFYTSSDDGVRLWVNSQLVIDDWSNHSPRTRSGTIDLLANELADIRMEYYENGGGAVIKLEWSGPGVMREFVKNNGAVSCQDMTVDVSGTGSYDLLVADVDPGYTDACGIDSRSLSKSHFTCSDLGVNPVVLTVTDVNGNSSQCNFDLTVTGAPDDSLAVLSEDQCEDENASISISDSENGVSYSAFFNGVQIGNAVNGNGSTINLIIPTVSLQLGNNTIIVKASIASCAVDLQNAAVIHVVSKPKPVGVFHD